MQRYDWLVEFVRPSLAKFTLANIDERGYEILHVVPLYDEGVKEKVQVMIVARRSRARE